MLDPAERAVLRIAGKEGMEPRGELRKFTHQLQGGWWGGGGEGGRVLSTSAVYLGADALGTDLCSRWGREGGDHIYFMP